MRNRYFLLVLLLIFSVSFLTGCGGTQSDSDDGLTEEERKQKEELDEIESLLGISSEKGGKPADKSGQESADDKLSLLETKEAPVKQTELRTVETQNLKKENDKLKSQVLEKDLIISDLKAQLNFQSQQLDNLQTQKPRAQVAVVTGDVAPEEYKMRYDEGFQLFQSRNYADAISVFESLLASDAKNALADNAQYWVGESHYALRKYDQAIVDFQKVFTFPNSNKAADAQFKLGLCYVRKGDKTKAREEFQRLLDLYPKSEYVSRAQNHLSKL